MNEQQKKIYQSISNSRIFDSSYYLAENPDVRDAKMNPLLHFVLAGDSEGRQPTAFFDRKWYQLQLGIDLGSNNSLLHYLLVGEKQGLQPIIGLDPQYVRQQVPGRDGAALATYVEAKFYKSHINPNPFFDHQFYLNQYPDVAQASVDGYLHFLARGADEGRIPSRGFSWSYIKERFNLVGTNLEVYKKLMLNWRRLDWANVKGEPGAVLLQDEVRENHRASEYHEPATLAEDKTERISAEIYAFYLPQFHRIKENDHWWGAGFTEWHNVVRGMPRFQGHYQPRIPADLGFYDLEDTRVMPRQAALAKEAGVDGFAFYYYHFGSQRLLEKPREQYLQNKSVDLGHFLIWANETFSRRWDGSEKEILLEQTYPASLLPDLVRDFATHFSDHRYKCIDGRPLLVIYRVSQIPDAQKFILALRRGLAKVGHNPLIYMAQSFDDLDPEKYGLDGAMEFPPHKLSKDIPLYSPDRVYEKSGQLRVFRYESFIDSSSMEEKGDYPLIKTCFPSWDNDGRRQGASSVVHGSTPELFGKWLHQLIRRINNDKSQPALICVNAWNEWGEGAYLEPDRRFGHAYLNTLQRARFPRFRSSLGKLVLVGHDAFAAGAQRLLLSLAQTYTQVFGYEVRILLLRADPGYDSLLERYRSVADVTVLELNAAKSPKEVIIGLQREGFSHAVLNTSAAAAALEYFSPEHWTNLLLVHELPGMLVKGGAYPILERFASHLHRVIVPSKQVADALNSAVGSFPQITRVCPQGMYRQIREIDTLMNWDAFQSHVGFEQRPTVVCNIGYADNRKGIDLFIDLCDLSRGQNFVFIWQGSWDAATHEQLKPKVEDLISTKKLILVPNSDHIEEVLNVADVFFLSSREDPMPSVAYEAWAVGKPVLAFSGTGGIAELIKHNSLLGGLATKQTARSAKNALDKLLREKKTHSAQCAELRTSWVRDNRSWGKYASQIASEVFSTPLLDIFVVGYNHGNWAEARLETLVRQSFPSQSIEYWDMGSSDGSLEKVRAVAEKFQGQIRVVGKKANHGMLFETWTEIAAKGTSTYLHIAEGDDTVSPLFLERSIRLLERHQDSAFAFAPVSWIDEDGKVITPSHAAYVEKCFEGIDLKAGYATPEQVLASQFFVQNPILSLSSVVWRREALIAALQSARSVFRDLSFAYDWVLYAAAIRRGNGIAYVPETLVGHRQHRKSMSAVGMKKHAEEVAKVYKALDKMMGGKHAEKRKAYLQRLEFGAGN